jgi:Fe-S cluster assembly scaffold protein SufB
MLRPLSEDERLVLVDPREFYVLEGETPRWDEITTIGRGERRAISLRIHIEAKARVRMVRVFEVPEGARLTIYHKVTIGEGASWYNAICIRGRGEVKIRRTIEVFGQGGEARLACLAVMGQSSRISVADEIFSHASQTKNELRTKIVLNDKARSEARGRIVVDEQSHQSTSYERLDHMLFGEHASAMAIPELEVRTDDVTCGHGATTSQPSEAELFYLTSRGLTLSTAERLVAQGLFADVLATMPAEIAQRSLEVMFD